MTRPQLRLALVLVLALAAAACGASKVWIFEKPHGTPVKLDQDMAECRKDATLHGHFSLFGSRIDQRLFNSCMAKRGWSAHQEDAS